MSWNRTIFVKNLLIGGFHNFENDGLFFMSRFPRAYARDTYCYDVLNFSLGIQPRAHARGLLLGFDKLAMSMFLEAETT